MLAWDMVFCQSQKQRKRNFSSFQEGAKKCRRLPNYCKREMTFRVLLPWLFKKQLNRNDLQGYGVFAFSEREKNDSYDCDVAALSEAADEKF